MNKDDQRRLRKIYQAMAAPERMLIERALLMKKKDRFGLIASIAGLSDEEQEFLYNLSQLTQEDIDELIAYAARGFIMRLLGRIFGF
jgi:hypothetical protein